MKKGYVPVFAIFQKLLYKDALCLVTYMVFLVTHTHFVLQVLHVAPTFMHFAPNPYALPISPTLRKSRKLTMLQIARTYVLLDSRKPSKI